MRALISVYDKTGIVEFARQLVTLGWELISTGGTLRALQQDGIPVTAVADITGFPEILDGRVKTLHPAIHGGLLARMDDPAHRSQLDEHGISPIGMVVSNLYPFEQTVLQPGVSTEAAIELIDIGGPAMLRAASKNHEHVIVVVDPADQAPVLAALRGEGLGPEFRRALAAKAFQHTAEYDTLVSAYLRSEDDQFPADLTFAGRKKLDLRYGENPHQQAAAYLRLVPGKTARGVLAAEQLQGKELSYNNLLDADAAWSAVQGWGRPAVSIIKHMIPCGLAVRDEPVDAYAAALAGDPISAFGGIVALNRPVDAALAAALKETFYEVILAPGFDTDARTALRTRKNLRLLNMSDDRPRARPGTIASLDSGRAARPTTRCASGRRKRLECGERSPTDRCRTGGPSVRLARRSARQVERHRLGEGSSGCRGRSWTAQPRRKREHCGAQSGESGLQVPCSLAMLFSHLPTESLPQSLPV